MDEIADLEFLVLAKLRRVTLLVNFLESSKFSCSLAKFVLFMKLLLVGILTMGFDLLVDARGGLIYPVLTIELKLFYDYSAVFCLV
mgnify:CR=1 FL=1